MPAIMIDVGHEEFTALAKKIRKEVRKDIVRNSIVRIRQAKSGGILIEIRGNKVDLGKVRAEVERIARTDVGVRTLQNKVLIETKNLNKWATKDEVADAIEKTIGSYREAFRVVSLRRQYGRLLNALRTMSEEAGKYWWIWSAVTYALAMPRRCGALYA